MAAKEKRKATQAESIAAELETAEFLAEAVDRLQTEVNNLQQELTKTNRVTGGKIGVALIVPGVLSLAFSILTVSQVLAFIGLGLTFWGALFFLIKPITYVKGSLLNSTAISSYYTIDRILKDLNTKGQSYYISPYPKEVYLPDHLKGLKETIVFIPASSNAASPSIEEIAKSKFITKNPKGLCLTPPGSGLLNQFEKELRADLTRMGLEDLCERLPQTILENFQLAKEIDMKTEENHVNIKIIDSIFKNLYREEGVKSVRSLGCPLVSAIASAIAKATGKTVSIESLHTTPDAEIIEARCHIIEA